MTPPANDVEAALAAWKKWDDTAPGFTPLAHIKTAGDALAELVARIPELEAGLEHSIEVRDRLSRIVAEQVDKLNGTQHESHAADGLYQDGCARCIIGVLRAEVSSLTARIEELNEEVVVAQDWRFKIGQLLESERVARQAAETERDQAAIVRDKFADRAEEHDYEMARNAQHEALLTLRMQDAERERDLAVAEAQRLREALQRSVALLDSVPFGTYCSWRERGGVEDAAKLDQFNLDRAVIRAALVGSPPSTEPKQEK